MSTCRNERWILCLVLVVGVALAGCPGEAENSPPTILTTPPDTAFAYETYTWELACADPEGDLVSLAAGSGDTCGGTVTDRGDRTGSYQFETTPADWSTDCEVEVVCDDGELQHVVRATVTRAPPPDAEDLTYDPFELWAAPIEDYISEAATALGHWNFAWGIHDLAVHADRLYLGYGDATLNTGSLVPIEIRAWTAPDPAALVTEFVTDEEQIDQYRQVGGRLLVPGVDAAEDGFMGQVYTLEATGWAKDRSVRWAWHVQDVTVQGDDLVACGSGGTSDDYANGTVNAYLYRRTPDATGFEIDIAIPHPSPPGDHRLTKLLVVGSELYATGFHNDYSVNTPINYRWTGSQVEDWSELGNFYVTETLSVMPDRGLVFGVSIGSTLQFAARVVTPAGVTEAAGLAGLTVISADPLPDGRALILARQGDTYPASTDGPWDVVVGITADGQDWTELLTQSLDVQPRSIAFWRDSLYLGLDDGTVWRAAGHR